MTYYFPENQNVKINNMLVEGIELTGEDEQKATGNTQHSKMQNSNYESCKV